MSVRMLKDDTLNRQLNEEGYVVVPFLNAEEIKQLSECYSTSHPVAKEGLYATANADGAELKKQLSNEIILRFTRAINELFFESRPLGGSYIVKYKGEKGVLFPHQDWGIVDEDFFRSFNIWVPLVDTNELNGAISVLPHSHKMLRSYRGVNIPDPFYKANSHAWQYHQTLNMKAGEALIYDHCLLHASAVNQTDNPRLAVVFGIISNKAALRYYYRNNDVVEEYESNVDFFFNNDFTKGPEGLKKIKDIHYHFPVVTNDEFDQLYFGKQSETETVFTEKKELPASTKKTFFKKVLGAIGI